MDNNSLTKQDSSIIQDPRGEIKMFSSPAKVVSKPEYFEEENVVSKKKRRFFSFRRVFRLVRFIGCWLPVLIIILITVLIFTRPAAIWGEVTTFLNDDLIVPSYPVDSPETTKESINSQLNNVGENIVYISESELTSLSSETLGQLKDLRIDLENNSLKFIWKLESSIESKPLYGIIEFELVNNDLIVKKIGTQRVPIPQFLNKIITDSVLSFSRFQGSNIQNNLIYTILPIDKSLTINSITIEKDFLKMDVNLNAGIF